MTGKELRIVYMGTPDFAVDPLRLLVEGGYNVVGVVTTADKPAGRGLKMQQSAVKTYAQSQNIPIYQPLKLKDPEWGAQFESLKPDLAIVVAFRMLPEVIWSLPPLGTFNLHASLLPQYRGAAPINWAIMNGEQQSGVTTFFLNHQIDCGAIIGQRTVDISDTDSAGTLHDKLMTIGARLVIDSVEDIAAGVIQPQDQPCVADPSLSTIRSAPKIFKGDCKIDWNDNITSIYNKIRGLSPYPAAWCDFEGTTAKLIEAHIELGPSGDIPGIWSSDNRKELKISCPGGWICIDRLQMAGKKSMNTDEFLRGYKMLNLSTC